MGTMLQLSMTSLLLLLNKELIIEKNGFSSLFIKRSAAQPE
jgi:hypothetical protein